MRFVEIFLQVAGVEGDHVEHSYEETKADSVEKNEEHECSNHEGADDDWQAHQDACTEDVLLPSKIIS